MSSRFDRAENERITKALARELGLDPSYVRDGFSASWDGGDSNVAITWRGIKTLPLNEWEEILNKVIKEGQTDG